MVGPDVPDVAEGLTHALKKHAVKVRRNMGWTLPLVKVAYPLLVDP